MDSELYQFILHYLISQSYSGIADKNEKRALRKKSIKYIAIKDKLYLKTINDFKPLVIQKHDVPKILREIHDDAGHQGIKYTVSLLKARYYWPNYIRTTEDYVKNCERCKLNQYSLKRPTEPLKPLPVISKPWYRVGMDLTGPLIESNGFKYILTMVDHFTKWVETRPLRSKETAEVARGIFSIYCSKGAPVQIICDNGKEFTSKLMSDLQGRYNCHLIFSAPYHPQTNGLVESYHKGLKSYLCKTLADKSERWSECLEQITFSVNIRPRINTTGFSAFELMHGFRKPRMPTEATNIFELHEGSEEVNLDSYLCDDEALQEFNKEVEKLKETVFERASQNLLLSKQKMKKSFDKNINTKVIYDLKVGDNVLIPNRKRRKGQLEDLWMGPYPIKKANIDTILIVKGENDQRIKKSQDKLWNSRETTLTAQKILPQSELVQDSPLNTATIVQFPGSITDSNLNSIEDILNQESLDLQEEEIEDASNSDDNSERDIILNTLNSMKVRIQNCISANIYLSEMHSELDKKINLSLKKITEWKDCNFPDAQTLSCHSEKIIQKLIKWYKEAKKANVKFWLITDEDRDNALYWGEKSVDYVTKVLYPVVSDLIASKIGYSSSTNFIDNTHTQPLQTICPITDIEKNSEQILIDNKFDPLLSFLSPSINELFNMDLEDHCPNWGGYFNSVRMDNTCPIDNIITILSINITAILNLIDAKVVRVSEESTQLFEKIKSREFNEAKFWIANKLNMSKLNKNRYDFYGTEGPLIEYLSSATGSDMYQISCTCWECLTIEDRTLNLTSVYKFITDCQTTIENQIAFPSCHFCHVKGSSVEKSEGKFIRLPLLFMLEVGHLSLSDINSINKTIYISHKNELVSFRLLGYTIHSPAHFYLRCLIKDEFYNYDGILKPKLAKTNATILKSNEVINTIFYILNANP